MPRRVRCLLPLLFAGVALSWAAGSHAQVPAGGAQAASPALKDTSATTGAPQGGGQGGGDGRGGNTGGAGAPGAPGDDKLSPLDPKAPPTTRSVAKTQAGGPNEPRLKDAPRTPTAETDDRSGWETWWLYNRDALLDLRAPAPVASAEGTAVATPAPRRGAVPRAEVDRRVRPALERLLAEESNPELLAELLLALARSGPCETGIERSPRLELLERALAHPQARVTEAAALALGVLGGSAALKPLSELARDTSAGRALCARDAVPYRVRALAAYAAGVATSQAANEDARRFGAEALMRLTAQRDVPREVGVACVGALGLAGLGSEPRGWKGSFERTAQALEPTASREALAAHLSGAVRNDRANPALRAHALTAVARLARDASDAVHDAAEALCIDLLAPNARVPNELAQSAALALADLSDAGASAQDRLARARLMAAAHEADLDTRHFALLALGRLAARPDEDAAAPFPGTAEAHRFLLRELADGRGGARSFAALALGLCGRGLRELGHTPSGEAADLLRERLVKSSSPDEAAACAIALGLRGDAGTAELLLARLAQAADDGARSSLCVGLGLAGADPARAAVRRVLIGARSRPALLREAAVALALLDDPQLTPELCAELAGAAGSGAEFGLLQALAVVGDERALDPLLAIANDADRSSPVRARAVASLGAICDPRRLPWNDALVRGANYLCVVETLTDPRGTGVLDLR